MKLSTRALASSKKLAVVAALAAICGSASAVTVTQIGDVGVAGTTFTSASAFSFNGVLQVLSGTFTSFSLMSGATTVGSASQVLPGIYTLDLTSVAAGTYTVASNAGTYNLYFTTTPVPEPETYALFFAGLGAVGFLTRRRSNG